MASSLKSNPLAVRGCILYETIKRKTMFHSYSQLCSHLGDDFMDFQQFEHFFRRYEKGETDLEYDGRPEFSTKLCDLPIDLLCEIMKRVPLEEKWHLRSVSKGFRDLIDPLLPGCKKIEISICGKSGTFGFTANGSNQISKTYYDENTGKVVVRFQSNIFSIVNQNIVDVVFADVRSITNNPKTCLKSLDVTLDFKNSDELQNACFEQLKSILESQTHIETVYIAAAKAINIHWVLSHLKPGVLKNINLSQGGHSRFSYTNMTMLYNMDQWKKAESVNMVQLKATAPPKKIGHLKRFEGLALTLKPETVCELKNELIRSTKMEYCKIFYNGRLDRIRTHAYLGPLEQRYDDNRERRHFRIQNSTKLLRLTTRECYIRFLRKDSAEMDQDDEESVHSDDESMESYDYFDGYGHYHGFDYDDILDDYYGFF